MRAWLATSLPFTYRRMYEPSYVPVKHRDHVFVGRVAVPFISPNVIPSDGRRPGVRARLEVVDVVPPFVDHVSPTSGSRVGRPTPRASFLSLGRARSSRAR